MFRRLQRIARPAAMMLPRIGSETPCRLYNLAFRLLFARRLPLIMGGHCPTMALVHCTDKGRGRAVMPEKPCSSIRALSFLLNSVTLPQLYALSNFKYISKIIELT